MKKDAKVLGKLTIVLLVLSAFLFVGCMNQVEEPKEDPSFANQFKQFAYEQINSEPARGPDSGDVLPGVYLKDSEGDWKYFSYEDIYTNLSPEEFQAFLNLFMQSDEGYIVKEDGSYVSLADVEDSSYDINGAFASTDKEVTDEDFPIENDTVVIDINNDTWRADGLYTAPVITSVIGYTESVYIGEKEWAGFTFPSTRTATITGGATTVDVVGWATDTLAYDPMVPGDYPITASIDLGERTDVLNPDDVTVDGTITVEGFDVAVNLTQPDGVDEEDNPNGIIFTASATASNSGAEAAELTFTFEYREAGASAWQPAGTVDGKSFDELLTVEASYSSDGLGLEHGKTYDWKVTLSAQVGGFVAPAEDTSVFSIIRRLSLVLPDPLDGEGTEEDRFQYFEGELDAATAVDNTAVLGTFVDANLTYATVTAVGELAGGQLFVDKKASFSGFSNKMIAGNSYRIWATADDNTDQRRVSEEWYVEIIDGAPDVTVELYEDPTVVTINPRDTQDCFVGPAFKLVENYGQLYLQVGLDFSLQSFTKAATMSIKYEVATNTGTGDSSTTFNATGTFDEDQATQVLIPLAPFSLYDGWFFATVTVNGTNTDTNIWTSDPATLNFWLDANEPGTVTLAPNPDWTSEATTSATKTDVLFSATDTVWLNLQNPGFGFTFTVDTGCGPEDIFKSWGDWITINEGGSFDLEGFTFSATSAATKCTDDPATVTENTVSATISSEAEVDGATLTIAATAVDGVGLETGTDTTVFVDSLFYGVGSPVFSTSAIGGNGFIEYLNNYYLTSHATNTAPATVTVVFTDRAPHTAGGTITSGKAHLHTSYYGVNQEATTTATETIDCLERTHMTYVATFVATDTAVDGEEVEMTVVATDTFGNRESVTVNFYVDNQAPVLRAVESITRAGSYQDSYIELSFDDHLGLLDVASSTLVAAYEKTNGDSVSLSYLERRNLLDASQKIIGYRYKFDKIIPDDATVTATITCADPLGNVDTTTATTTNQLIAASTDR